MTASASVNQMNSAAPSAARLGPKRKAAYAAPRPASSSTRGYLALMRAPQWEHFALRRIQLTSGMFSSAVMPCPHEGQRERGVTRLSGGSCGAGWPASDAHSARHSRSSILGSRWITTLRNEPTHSPKTSATQGSTVGWASQPTETTTLDSLAHLEDGEVHGDHHAADQRAEHHHDHRLHEGGERFHRIVHLGLVEVGHLAEHGVERAGLLADLAHLQHHRREHVLVLHRHRERTA